LTGTVQRIVRQFDPTVLAYVRTSEDNLEHETTPLRVGQHSRYCSEGWRSRSPPSASVE